MAAPINNIESILVSFMKGTRFCPSSRHYIGSYYMTLTNPTFARIPSGTPVRIDGMMYILVNNTDTRYNQHNPNNMQINANQVGHPMTVSLDQNTQYEINDTKIDPIGTPKRLENSMDSIFEHGTEITIPEGNIILTRNQRIRMRLQQATICNI
jgi:hypothetical protein